MVSVEAKVDGPLTPIKPEFAIEGIVISRARGQVVWRDADRLRCADCNQSVLWIKDRMHFTMNDLEAVILGHLMQQHGWTREMPGGQA